MRKPLGAAILALMAAHAFSSEMLGQTTKKAEAPKPAASGSGPNLTGLWSPVGDVTFDPSDPAGKKAADLAKYPMTPWGLERFRANKPAHGDEQTEGSNDPVNRCVPPAVPRAYVLPSPMEIVQTSERVVMLFEYNSMFRVIYMDGKQRPKDADP